MKNNLQAIRTALKGTIKNRRYVYAKDDTCYRVSNCDWAIDLSFLDDTARLVVHADMMASSVTQTDGRESFANIWTRSVDSKVEAFEYEDSGIRLASDPKGTRASNIIWAILSLVDKEQSALKFVAVQEKYLELFDTVYKDHKHSFWFNPSHPVLVWSDIEDRLLGCVMSMRLEEMNVLKNKFKVLGN